MSNLIINTKIDHNLAKKAKTLISNCGFYDSKVLFVTDEKIWRNSKNFFEQSFLESNKVNLILKNAQADEKNLNKIFSNIEDCNLIIALGSGVISDLCKFTSAQKNIPYIVFASAASMNGYLSKNASIKISGHKKTLPATLPVAVFCDLGILKKAPKRLTKAGIGDLMCFYNCWFDWYLSNQILGTKFEEKAFLLLEKEMKFFVSNFKKFSLQDDNLIKMLIEILLLSGHSMTIAGGSYPASQAEHLIAHTIDMKYKKIAKEKLHGELIAVTTLVTAKLQKDLLKKTNLEVLYNSEKEIKKSLTGFFGKKVALQCFLEYQEKLELIKKVENLSKKWKIVKKDLLKIHFDELKIKEIFSHFKINNSIKSLGLSKRQFQKCVSNAKFIRNRFTCLDLL